MDLSDCVSWFLTQAGIVTSISCVFSIRSSLLQILRNSFRLHSVLMLLSLSSVTNLSLLFGFCAACMLSYRCLPMEFWAAVTVVAIPSQPALLMWPCVSANRPSELSPWASRTIVQSRHPADCILPILDRKVAVGVVPATAFPKRLLRFHGIFFVTQRKLSFPAYTSLHPQAFSAWGLLLMSRRKAGGCLLFFVLLDTSLFESLLFNPYTMPPSRHGSHTRVIASIDLSSWIWHIELLPAKILDYFLLSNDNNINQLLICFQAPVTRFLCLRTTCFADPRLIAVRTHVDFRSS